VFAWEKALALLDDMRVADYHPVVDHYNRALLACERANQWEQVMQIWESLKVSGTPDRMSFSVLLTRSCQLSLWQDALRFWKDMGPDMANEMVCSQIMRACGRAGKWEIALALMDVMQDQEMVLDEVIYGTAIQACERARKWQHALALLVTLLPVERARQEEGPQVDFLGLTEEDWDVIESLEDETSDPRMEFLWDEFKDLYGIEEEEEEVTPDSAVEAVLRTLEVQEPHISPNLPIFSSTVRALSRGFQVARALDILEQMACAGIQRDLMLMSDFATGCADAWHSSLQLLEDVLDKGDLVVDTPLINAVTWAMTCAKCWTRALEMRQVLDNQSLRPSTVTFNTLLTACVQARAAAACQALLQELQRSECLPNQDTEKLIAEIRDQVKIQPLPTSRQKTAMPKTFSAQSWKALRPTSTTRSPQRGTSKELRRSRTSGSPCWWAQQPAVWVQEVMASMWTRCC
ncbi:Pentatricopeptide repeat-containing protein At2g31400, partial [Durusdinium trenchii]